MDSANLGELAHCRCLAARRISRVITRVFDARLRDHGLRATQFSVLAELALNGPLATHALADALGMERTTLTRSAAVLAGEGWIGDERSGAGRERPLHLTAAGRAKLESAFPAWKAAQDFVGLHLARPASGEAAG